MVTDIPETSNSLLVRVKDLQDRDAWERFAQIYGPAVYRLARGRGMQHADAQDLSQRVLMSVAHAMPDWQRQSPDTKFRYWLRRVAKNAVINALSRQPKDLASGGSSTINLLHQQADPTDDTEQGYLLEYRRQLIRHAAQIVRRRVDETTWLAFSLTMIDGLPISVVAERIGRSEGVVYAARSRIMKRLKEIIREMESELDE